MKTSRSRLPLPCEIPAFGRRFPPSIGVQPGQLLDNLVLTQVVQANVLESLVHSAAVSQLADLPTKNSNLR